MQGVDGVPCRPLGGANEYRELRDAIGWAPLDLAPPMLSLKNQDLVAECGELGFQVGPPANEVPDSTEEGDQSSYHRSTMAQLHAEGELLASQPRM